MIKDSHLFAGIIMIIAGAAWTIVASFNLKHDPAWISILIISVLIALKGINLIERK